VLLWIIAMGTVWLTLLALLVWTRCVAARRADRAARERRRLSLVKARPARSTRVTIGRTEVDVYASHVPILSPRADG